MSRFSVNNITIFAAHTDTIESFSPSLLS